MTEQVRPGEGAVRSQRLFALDDLCDAFESRWQQGDRAAIEEYLSKSGPEVRAELLEELLALEIAFRKQQGDVPQEAEYVQRFPEFDTLVGRIFADPERHQRTRVDQETQPVGSGHPSRRGKFGAYELLAEIGRGGMGVVYKAYQPALDRTVAIKMILAGHATPEHFVERFRAEAKTLAKLLHPGIVPIFDVGEVDGQHYFSMEYVEGQTLTQRIAAGDLAPREAARLTREVADVIHFAHEQGVLHRDIKPSNILITPPGRARVMDFGLAKQLQGDSQTTRSGEVLGTPSYMSPEQASGRWKAVDRHSDVYSLGAVLYAMLTGRPPFQGESPLATMHMVVQAQPQPPSELNPMVEPELERICLKCLEKDPARRYASAADLARDLEQYSSREAANGVSTGTGGGPSKRLAFMVGTAAVAALILAAVVITFQSPQGTVVVEVPDNVAPNLQVRVTKAGVVEVADAASKWRLQLKEGKYDLQLAGGDDEFKILEDSIVVSRNKETRVTITRKPAEAATETSEVETTETPAGLIPAGPVRSFAKGERLGRQALVEQPAEIKNVLSWTIEPTAHRAPVTSLAYFRDGARVVSTSKDGTLRLWNAETGAIERVLVSSDGLDSCDVSADGRHIAACGSKRLEIWEVASGRLLRTLPLEEGRPSITRWSRWGNLVACAIDNRGVYILDPSAGKAIDVLPASEPITALAWDQAARQIALATKKGGVEVYHVETGEKLYQLQASKDLVTSIAWKGNSSTQLFTAGAVADDGALGARTWSLGKEGATSRAITGTEAAVTQVAWQDAEQRLLLVLENGHGELRDFSGKVVRKYENRTRAAKPTVAVWSPDGASAASADATGALTFRATRTGADVQRSGLAVQFAAPTWNSAMPALEWSAVGNRIAYATPNARDESSAVPGIWPISGKVAFQAAGPGARHHLVVSLAWSDDGELLATGGSDPQTIIWNKDGRQRQVLPTGGWVTGPGFAPKSHRLAVGHQGGEIHVWDLATQTKTKLISPHKSWVSFRWSSDGKQMASTSYDGKLALWNVESGEAIQTITKDRAGNGLGEAHCVDLSPDGKYLAAGSLERAWIFRADTGENVHTVTGGGWVYSVRFSPDSKHLAIGSGNGKLRLADVSDGTLKQELQLAQTVAGVAWSPDSRFVAGSTTQRVSIYSLSGKKQLDLIPLGMTAGLAISPAGHVRSESDQIVYVLQTATGQVTVRPQEMDSRWGWKNDPGIALPGQ